MCKMTVGLVSMSHSLTIDRRLCSDKDTKEERQYVPYVRTTYIVTHVDRGPLEHSTGTYAIVVSAPVVNVPRTTV